MIFLQTLGRCQIRKKFRQPWDVPSQKVRTAIELTSKLSVYVLRVCSLNVQYCRLPSPTLAKYFAQFEVFKAVDVLFKS